MFFLYLSSFNTKGTVDTLSEPSVTEMNTLALRNKKDSFEERVLQFMKHVKKSIHVLFNCPGYASACLYTHAY